MKALFLTLSLLLCLSGCTERGAVPAVQTAPVPTPVPEPTPSVLTVCVGTEGCTIDPHHLVEEDPADYISHLFEGLMKYAPVTDAAVVNDAVLTYGLAETAQCSEDGLEYRFTLRNDACWSDGVPITAEDFVYSWQRLMGSDNTDGLRLRELVDSVQAEGQHLTVKLRAPCPYFLKLCAEPSMAPVRRDVIETWGGDWTGEEHIVTSGGYTIRSWVHDDHMVLEQNPYYYDAGALGPEVIEWYFRDCPDTTAYDLVTHVPEDAATGSVSVGGTYYLYLNANAIRDWRIRAAMLLAIDREAIAAAVGEGATPAMGMIPAGISMTDGTAYAPDTATMYAWLAETYSSYDLSDYEGRCTLARDLYNQSVCAGAWSYSRTLTYRFNDSELSRTAAEICQKNWLEVLGLTVKLADMQQQAYTDLLNTNTFDVAYLSWMADFDDPQCFLEIMRRGGEHNHSGWGDVRYNDLLDQAALCTDSAQRDAMLNEADSALFEKERFAVCPLFWLGETYYAAEDIRGAAHSPVGGLVLSYVNQ